MAGQKEELNPLRTEMEELAAWRLGKFHQQMFKEKRDVSAVSLILVDRAETIPYHIHLEV